jgi:hypothetical protein
MSPQLADDLPWLVRDELHVLSERRDEVVGETLEEGMSRTGRRAWVCEPS